MKLISVAAVQAVLLKRKTYNYLSCEIAGFEEMSLVLKDGYVDVEHKDVRILIPLSNIVYMIPANEIKKAVK